MTEIRRATEDDTAALVEVLAWLPIRSRVIETSPEGDLQVNKDRLRNPYWCTLVAVDPDSQRVQGAAVGYDSRYFESATAHSGTPPIAKLEDLAVQSEYERKGIGANLVQAFEEWARSRGCVRVEISGGPKPAFYEKCGYERQSPFFRFVKNL